MLDLKRGQRTSPFHQIFVWSKKARIECDAILSVILWRNIKQVGSAKIFLLRLENNILYEKNVFSWPTVVLIQYISHSHTQYVHLSCA